MYPLITAFLLCPFSVFATLSPTPPIFFISFHGGDGKKDVNDIYRYSLDGTPLQKKIFSNGIAQNLHGLRGLLYVDTLQTLLVTNAFNQDSRIIKLDVGPQSDFACKGAGPAVDLISDGSVLHPYGIQLNPLDNSIVISNQGDPANPPQNITQYDLNGKPLATPVFTTIGDPRDLYWATFADSAFLFICDKESNRVLKFDRNGVQMKFTAKVDNPIALHTVDPPSGEGVIPWLLVSSNAATESAVYALDFLTGGDTTGSKTTYKRKYTNPSLDHPCGMATLGNTLYVLSQNTYSLLAFDLQSASLLSIVVSGLPDIPEDLMLASMPECSLPPTTPHSLAPTTAGKGDGGLSSQLPPIYFIAAGAALGGAMVLGMVAYWCKRRRDYKRNNPRASPLQEQQEKLFEPAPAHGSVQV